MTAGNTYHITIEGMEFHAPIGCYELEQKVGCHLSIDVDIEVPKGPVFESDCVTDTVSYLEAYEVICEVVKRPRHTLENLVSDIISTLRTRFGKTIHVCCKARKMAPPLGGKTASVAVTAEE